MFDSILNAIQSAMLKERDLTPQVANHICSTYTIGEDEIPRFFEEQVSKLDETEMDLLFSPLFTPRLEDMACFSPILDRYSPTPEEIRRLIQTLTGMRLKAKFWIQDIPLEIEISEVLIERYVQLLYLDRQIPENLNEKIERLGSGEDIHRVKALVRSSSWVGSNREAIVSSVLDVFLERGGYTFEKFEFLNDFIKTYRPDTLTDAQLRLKNLLNSYRTDSDSSFFDDYLKEAYSDGKKVDVTKKAIEGRNLREIWKLKSEVGDQLLSDFQSVKIPVR